MPSDAPESAELREEWEQERQPLAAEILQIKDAAKATWEALGKETGIAYQTLQSWATGKYLGRVDRVNDQVRKYLAARAERLRTAASAPAEPDFVATPTAEAFMLLLRQAHYLPTMVTAVGSPGVGKTTAATHYAQTTPNTFMVTALPGHPSGRWLLEELGRVMRLTERGGSQRLASVIIERLRGARALIIVDEANHLATPTIDLLRSIHDQAKCGVALLGNERVLTRLEGTARDADFAQLFRRLGGRMRRQRPTRRDVELLLAAWQVEDAEVQRLLHAVAARPGALGAMIMTLRMAHMLAAAEGKALGAEHIRAADAQLTGAEHKDG